MRLMVRLMYMTYFCDLLLMSCRCYVEGKCSIPLSNQDGLGMIHEFQRKSACGKHKI